jgi:RNA polymerase-interacting CarD/CdnL/TRCF family regulator
MEYSIGDMVMHPQFGPARIMGLEDQEWVEGFKRYCVLEVPGHNMILRLPVRKLDASGLRPLMSRSKLVQVMCTLGGAPETLSDDANERHRELQERVRTCKPLKMASVIRDLTWRQRDIHLTKRDIDLLDRARQLLTSEIASATDSQVELADQAIDGTLANAIAAHPDAASAEA